jgi:hypothetical protein
MNKKLLSAAVIAAGTLYLPQATAHHALEYIDVSSYSVAEQGQFLFYALYDNMVDDSADPGMDHWEFTPGFSYGITDWLMLDTHMHYAKFGAGHLTPEGRARIEAASGSGAIADRVGPSPFLEAGTISLQAALPSFGWLNVGVEAAVEFPFKGAKRYLGADDNVYEFGLILDHEFGEHQRITANIVHWEEGDEDGDEWRLGIRTPLSPNPEGIAGGIELQGSFDESAWSFMPGIYAPLARNIIAKTGVQITKDFEAQRFHVSAMFIF